METRSANDTQTALQTSNGSGMQAEKVLDNSGFGDTTATEWLFRTPLPAEQICDRIIDQTEGKWW